MLRLAIALTLAWQCLAQLNTDLIVTEEGILSPPYFNIASGKHIEATATCGTGGPELFCKLTGGTNFEFSNSVHQGQVCDVCNSNTPGKSHPANNAIDGTEKWWQSPPLSRGNEFNKVNMTIHLGQVFHVAYVLIKFANSPRAGTWVLERSSDYGASYQPWQYFANTNSDCYNLFGMDSLEEITRDDSVKCTSDYSSVVPLENGEVIVSMVKGRPGSYNFSYAPVLQEWSKATNVRLRFLRTKTLLGHLMAVSEQDPTVTRRYYYSIKDISIGGRCVCNGHADTCRPDPLDLYKSKCLCQHNTCGSSCEYCCPGFEQKAWRAAVPGSTNECEACNCHGHSTSCYYDEEVAKRRLSLDLAGNYEGGGVCINCTHNTAGINCELCAAGYWRPSHVDPHDPNGCRPCDCDSAYTVGSCEPNTGRCYCKVQYAGDRCDRCAPGYYDFPECRLCDCYYNGTLDGVCLPINDACPCKYNYAGKYCNECARGFFNFPKCDVCECHGEGVSTDVCDPYTGDCPCADGFAGPACDRCARGYFNYPLCQRCPCSEVGTTPEICDITTGECFCNEKFTGQSCDDCKPGYYGFPLCEACQCFGQGSYDNTCDTQSGRCYCKPNYRGDRCEECAPEFYGYPNCVSCACDIHGSLKTTCDPVTGKCLCRENIGGQRCDECTPDYFNFPRCEECSCDARGIESIVPGVCLAFTTGQCECKENVMGKNCDMCKPLHYDLDRGCVSCNCFVQGTLDGVGECDTDDGQCWCRPYTCSQRCSQCEDGFFSLEERNYLGCTSCECDIGGAMTAHCDKNSGQCNCKDGIGGRRCNRAVDGFFFPTLYQNQYELEDGSTPDRSILRYGFDNTEFHNFSMRGYAQFSTVQPTIVMHISVDLHNLYRVLVRYVNPTTTPLTGTVSFVTYFDGTGGETSAKECLDCTEQSYPVTFDISAEPRVITIPNPFVLNRGTWTVVIEAQPGLLVDYLVLLPSEFYEPGILQLSTTTPCIPTTTPNGKECVMFSHPNLDSFTMIDLPSQVDRTRLATPSTAHPEMVHIDATVGDIEQSKFSTKIALPQAGKYILVLEYASNADRFQTAQVTVTDGASNNYDNVKFNVYSCPYSFLCRQVALGVLNDVQVFDMSLPVMRVSITTESGTSFYVKSLTAIPLADWTMELVEPKPRCITMSGPEFDRCVATSYNVPLGASRFNVPPAQEAGGSGDEEPIPPVFPDTMDKNVDVVYLDDADKESGRPTALQIPMDLQPGRYVFLVHYYNPDFTSFSPRVVIDGGVTSTGTVNVTHCPFSDGCRGVVTTDDGRILVDITVPTTMFTITVPDGKAFWIEYVLAIPEEIYDQSLLDLAPIDKSTDFILMCSTDGQQSFYNTIENPSEFCRDSIFSLTVDYNDGGLECNCSGAGTVGGGDAVCADYGGQCPCKPHVIGRRCDQCETGYYNYPDCMACDCGGALCDKITGECICPPNTVKPGCDTCVPFTHSFHPEAGCDECDCNVHGVINVADQGCDPADGQCKCKENVSGQRCDRCSPGYFGFPDCQKCTCDERGALAADGCDPINGQCACKENVEGLQCNVCKAGTFYLDINNPLGCTECFCFGVGTGCSRSQYPATEISDMEGWIVLNLVNDEPEIVPTNNGATINVNIDQAGGQEDPTRPNIYWAAPRTYLGQLVGSYGGELRYTTTWSSGGGRGDSSSGGSAIPAPLLGAIPDVILKGNDLVVGWTNPNPSSNVRLELVDRNFLHDKSGNPVSRADMMMILSNLQSLHIRASPEINIRSISLDDVVMTTTDYSLPIGSGPSIPAVEECTCPPGYVGHSCEECAAGHRRDDRGQYLGYCTQCNCFPHCISCDESGNLLQNDTCMHNTAGPDCGRCTDGYIKNTTSGDIESCQPCPCPFPDVDGNFADTCEELDGDLVCHCKIGYTGERCERCANGYFGNPAVYGGFCQPCNCHDNLDPNLIMEDCDPLTGVCYDCQFNTGGKYCERCADGYYGDAITAKNCTECDCSSCGTDVCDHYQGHCSCQPHVIGHLCDTCEPGYWNFQSCSGCQRCNCAGGAIGKECDIATGQCTCAPNIVGLRCDRCAPGFYEYSEMGCKPCKCRNNGPCNPKNGKCECPPGITGDQCDQCELARHILHEGKEECTRCGTCTDDLLDVVEPMTSRVTRTLDTLANVSLGVVAYQRLEKLQNEVENSLANLDMEEGLITTGSDTVGNLLNGGLDALDEMVSGSGANGLEEVSGGTTSEVAEIRSSLIIDLDNEISQIETSVSQMCNHTDVLLGQVKSTENETMGALANARALDSLSAEFMNEAKDLKDRLTKEATGDSDDYEEKLAEAEQMVKEMNERDFGPMMMVADTELTAAQALLHNVMTNFSEPAANVSSQVETLSNDFSDKQMKLRDLRNKMNNATAKINDATTANAVNRKNLSETSEALNNINTDAGMATDLLSDAEQLLNATKASVNGPITNGISELDNLEEGLNQAMGELQPYTDLLNNDLEKVAPLVNQSMEKASQLAADVQALQDIIDNVVTPENAANAYQRIVIAMTDAANAAEKALNASINAEMDVADKNLQEAAEMADQKSSTLLAETEDLQQNGLAKLQKDMEDVQNNLNAADGTADDRQSELDAIKDRINGLNRDGIDADLDLARTRTESAVALTEQANTQADELQAQIASAPDTNIDLGRELEATRAAFGDVPTDLVAAISLANELLAQKKALENLDNDLQMPKKIQDIQKKIALTRNVANSVKSSIKFVPLTSPISADNPPEYVELRTPVTVVRTEDHVRAEFLVSMLPEATDNSIMMIGDGQESGGDYMALETRGGNVFYHFKVGGGIATIESDRPINTDIWHKIVVERTGNEGRLIIEYPETTSPRGDSTSTSSIKKEWTGRTNSDDLVSTMKAKNIAFFMGGVPKMVPDVMQNRQADACVSGLSLNHESMGFWNYKSYSGPKPGRNCLISPAGLLAAPTTDDGAGLPSQQIWRFRGLGSYIRIAREDTPFLTTQQAPAHFVGFTMETLQDNSLLFLVGQSTEQFMALEVVDGKLKMSWNFGFPDGPASSTVADIEDVNASQSPIRIRAGVAPRYRMIVMSVNLRLKLQKEFQNGSPNITGDLYLGGMWYNDINPSFYDVLSNVNVSYRGCLSSLNFNSQTFDIQNAIENVGVTRGCRKETAEDFSLEGTSYIMTESALRDAQLDGMVAIESDSPTGTILAAKDPVVSVDTEVIRPEMIDPNDPGESALGGGDNSNDGLDAETETDASSAENVEINGNAAAEQPDNAPPADTEAPEPSTHIIPPIGDEFARFALPPDTKTDDEFQPEAATGTLLPVVLIVIGVIVSIVLIGAVVSALLKSSLVSGGAAPPPPAAASPEQMPLNDVQAQRTAQMDW
uniref:Laminin subunit alpha-5 n=1 Tax=Phallusia mammillata TaxID=59560 RepID=A0A6F9DIX3_9ASCI|nr:laminin subunit alpha-5 [Phallusia mammillata]